ncbi:MAG: TRAM domain-containing protein [Chromatiales bacterium]
MQRAREHVAVQPATAENRALSPEGRGVARVDGKTVFVDDALPGEEVRLRYRRRHARYDEIATPLI